MDKLTIINRALIATGNDPLNALYDGSDEWVVADNGFERMIGYLAAEHQWPFATRTAVLQRAGDADDPAYTDAYAIPPDALHIRSISWGDHGTPLSHYTIQDNKVLTRGDDRYTVRATYVRRPDDETRWHPMAEEVMTRLMEAHVLRGLNEDARAAEAREASADTLLVRSQTRIDQQSSPRPGFRPGMTMARRTRRA